MAFKQYFKFENWWIGGFVFLCQEQVKTHLSLKAQKLANKKTQFFYLFLLLILSTSLTHKINKQVSILWQRCNLIINFWDIMNAIENKNKTLPKKFDCIQFCNFPTWQNDFYLGKFFTLHLLSQMKLTLACPSVTSLKMKLTFKIDNSILKSR